MAIYYMDPVGGNNANDGLSFANRKRNTLPTLAAGDEVRYIKSPDPVNIGDVTWTNNGTLTLASARTLDLYKGGDGAWVASSANVSVGTNAIRKVGATTTVQITPLAAFTTGKIAHYATGLKDCSAYSKIHLWFLPTIAVPNGSIYQIALCSDTDGNVPVNTLTFTAYNYLANIWVPLTLDNLGPLGNNIQSIALYATTDPGNLTLRLDNIYCTNDISSGSVISKGNNEAPDIANGEHPWFPIRSIVGTTITLEYGGQGNSASSASPGYFGTTETVTGYAIQPDAWPQSAGATATPLNLLLASGVSGTPILFSGGWNTTDMSTQTGASWYSLVNGGGIFLAVNNRSFINFEKIGIRGGNQMFNTNTAATNCNISRCYATGTIGIAFQINTTALDTNFNINSSATTGCTTGIEFIANNSQLINSVSILNLNRALQNPGATRNTKFENLVLVDGGVNAVWTIQSANLTAKNITMVRGIRGIYMDTSADGRFDNITISNASTCAVQLLGATAKFYNLTTSGNNNIGFDFNTRNSRVECYNWVYDESSPFNSASTTFADSRLISTYDDGIDGSCLIHSDGSVIDSQTIVRRTDSGIAWRMRPTNANRTSNYPVWQRITSVFCEASIAKTISVWVRRDNTDITGRLILKANDIVGVTTDQTSSISVPADTWEQLSITFTPISSQFVDVYIECWGGTTHSFYWDDFSSSPTSSLDTSSGDYLNYTAGVGVAALGGGLPTTKIFASVS